MNWDAFGALGEVLGAIAVVLTLWYVAGQIRQNWRATRASTVHGVNTAIANAWRPFQDSSRASVYIAALEGIDSLSAEERVRFFALMHVVAKTWEDTWFQWRVGTLGDAYWEGQQASFLDIFSQPGPQEYWALRKHWFDLDFREFMENALDAHEATDMHYLDSEPPRAVD